MKYSEERKISDSITEVYVIDEDGEEKEERLAFQIKHNSKTIDFFPEENDYFVKVIQLDGFSTIPKEFSDKGYILGSVSYYLNVALKDREISKFVVSKNKPNSFRKTKNGYSVVVSYKDFSKYKQDMTTISTEAKFEKRQETDNFLATLFPSQFTTGNYTIGRKKSRFVNAIDKSIIPSLEKKDLDIIQDFFEALIDRKYIQTPQKIKLLTTYKENIDHIALSEALSKFKDNLGKNVSESLWGEYLKQYLFLLESKYIRMIPELNVSLITWRKVDFGLIDSQGFLDIFEIKKPTTPLLSTAMDRGNYYWHNDMTKAIVQAEKYLYGCERKGADITEAIKRECDWDVKVVKPRTVLIAGHSSQFTNRNMEEDFRILRGSLKNVEIILYDELYTRLQNLQQRTYTMTGEP